MPTCSRSFFWITGPVLAGLSSAVYSLPPVCLMAIFEQVHWKAFQGKMCPIAG